MTVGRSKAKRDRPQEDTSSTAATRTSGSRLGLEKEAVKVLQSIAGQRDGIDDARLGKHLRFLLDLGFLSSTLTSDGVSYRVTKDGSRFLQEYDANASSKSGFKNEMDWVLERLLKNQVTVVIPTLNEDEDSNLVLQQTL